MIPIAALLCAKLFLLENSMKTIKYGLSINQIDGCVCPWGEGKVMICKQKYKRNTYNDLFLEEKKSDGNVIMC